MNSTQAQAQALPLSPRVHWIGAFDPGLRSFDIILKTPAGTTYNAYAVRGSSGVAIIDTVKAECAGQFFARLESVARYDEIRFIVLNHLEPDHTGALPELMRRAPQARLIVSEAAQQMLKALLNSAVAHTPAAHGDTVSLGDRTLRFLNTPYLHWPDTQCTYLEQEAILFSGDVFGCHWCDERLFDDSVGDFRPSFEYYYAHIMRPFKEYVLAALDLIEPLALDIIAPAHGPVLREQPRRYVARYRELSAPRPQCGEKTLIVFYISSYGNTKRMALAIADGARVAGGLRVALHDLEGGAMEQLVDLVEQADAILLGTPTINGDAVKPVWDLLSSLAAIKVKGKVGGAFGSFGWSGEAVRMVDERLRGLKMRVPLAGLRIKLIPSADELDACHRFGRDIGDFVLGKPQEANEKAGKEIVIDMAQLLAR